MSTAGAAPAGHEALSPVRIVRFRVMTYNIHRCIGVDRRFRPERIVAIINHHDPDLVLLQEVDEGAPRSRELNLARELAEAAGYPHFALGHNVSLRKGWYGNATLSRFPVRRERNIDLTIGRRKRRGCQHTTLLLPPDLQGGERRLELFNLHLGLSAREREQQAGVLLRCDELADLPPEQPCIVGGDFNDWRSLLRPLFTQALGFRNATDLKSRNGVIRTYPSFSPRGGLDRVYYRGGLRLIHVRTSRLQLCRVASDHLPVVLDFELS
ncbi:MAG TPA: endonuclease/exonuclease/phosphatase family protein [Thermoanaerobaculia bacterium]|nr:endonuclease/exonuclease/phosphatase family protein [Thermoanaerobaculia bacterium]